MQHKKKFSMNVNTHHGEPLRINTSGQQQEQKKEEYQQLPYGVRNTCHLY